MLYMAWASLFSMHNTLHLFPLLILFLIEWLDQWNYTLQVTAKFRCVVRVVAAFPWRAEDFRSPLGTYRIRLTLEDPTARIHAFLYAEDGVNIYASNISFLLLLCLAKICLLVTLSCFNRICHFIHLLRLSFSGVILLLK